MARIALSKIKEINLAPESVDEDVTQCASMIFGTPLGTVPYMREFGADATLVDNRMSSDINDIVDESFEQIEKYEPRMILRDVTQEGDAQTGSVQNILTYTLDGEEQEEAENE